MIYLDTDYLIHYLVIQDKEIHRVVHKKLKTLFEANSVFISLLTLQEVSFVLSKLGLQSYEILEKMEEIENFTYIYYTKEEFERAKFLASKIGFTNINDCRNVGPLHTAIAESYCKELYTFNKNDFENIKKHTTLKIKTF
jgi:predicted nucleic acid-binding protein